MSRCVVSTGIYRAWLCLSRRIFCGNVHVFSVNKREKKTQCTDCIQKMVQSEKTFLIWSFFQNVCIFGIILKQINCSFCCFLNHIICFCKSRVMLCFVYGKAKSRLCHFLSSWKFQQQQKIICEDNDERNYWNIFKYHIYYLVAHTQTHTHTHIHTHTRARARNLSVWHKYKNCVCVCVCVRVYLVAHTNIPYIQHTR